MSVMGGKNYTKFTVELEAGFLDNSVPLLCCINKLMHVASTVMISSEKQ